MDAGSARRPSARQHYWDTLRAALMLLGIPYHSALAFQAGGWIVATHRHAPVLDYVAEAIHLFRMPAFFLVAGYFAALSLTKYPPGGWFRARLTRLGIPFLASLVTIIPLLNIGCELSNFAPAQALESWRNLSLTSGGYWVRHLWFIIVLLYLCGATALAARIWPALRTAPLPARIDRWTARRPLATLLLLGLVVGLFEAVTIELFYAAHLNTTLPQEILRLDDLLGALPWFVLGLALQRAPETLAAMGERRAGVAALAVAATALALALYGHSWPPLYRFVGAGAAMLVTQVILSVARQSFDRASPVTDRLVRGSFVVYLFHVPVIVWLALIVDGVGLPPEIGFVVVACGTLAATLGIAALIERSPALSLLYSGTRGAARPRARRQVMTAVAAE
ncbi:acyltransferase family protein [Sphingomonas sp. H39-1-10]|uniref:acyltransferase family protein n=1 Tax=Sphingomonas pollutisoli TaxID=3030829 RepID=UPI0023BA36AF|nr:acyltransferase family protein [Sphingomonas pollutisoli]MDF0488218.1 acyltransferase family protein [Sphingomonas pollutisoli]